MQKEPLLIRYVQSFQNVIESLVKSSFVHRE